MNEKYVAIFLSIVAGAGGYLLITFYFQPILRYREIKHQVLADLIFYANAITFPKDDVVMQERWEQRIESNRRHSAQLTACCKDLPRLYKKYLSFRDENPEEAATQMRGLSNTADYDGSEKRIDKIKQLLKIDD